MSADWFFLRHGWFHRAKKIGPIDDHELMIRIDRGELTPDTLVQSDTKTRGRWIRMEKLQPALKRFREAHPSES